MASPIPLEGLKRATSFLAVAGLSTGREPHFSVRIPHGGQHTTLVDTQYMAYIVDKMNTPHELQVHLFFPSETSLFAQDQTDNPSDSNGAGYRCTCPHFNPPAHPPVTPPLNCIAILLAR
jgi:hypothetical protein